MASKKTVKVVGPRSLWPDFDLTERPRSIRRAILDAGSGLEDKTEGKIRFQVESVPSEQGGFTHNCYLFAPEIDYRYPFLKVIEHASSGYPVNIVADVWKQGALAGDEKALIDSLGLVFRSDSVKKAILNLVDVLES